MSELFFAAAQFLYTLWPLILITVLIYSLVGGEPTRKSRRGWLRTLQLRLSATLRRIRRNLLLAWLALAAIWAVTLFADGPTPTLLPEPWNSLAFWGGLALLILGEALRLKGLTTRLHALSTLHQTGAIQDLKRMDPYEFEALIAETYRAYGYNVRLVGQSGDHGVDVELRSPTGEYWIVQCKRYRDSVGESIIRDLYGAMISEGAARAALVTTAEITQPARDWARGKPIELVDGPALLRMIDNARRINNGSLFDRFATALNRLFTPPLRPAGLQSAAPLAVDDKTVAVPPPRRIIYTRAGVPVCPRCGVVMVPRPLSPRDLARGSARIPPLYRCRNAPTCRVVLEGRSPEQQVAHTTSPAAHGFPSEDSQIISDTLFNHPRVP